MPKEPAQTGEGPAMVQLGTWLTVTFLVQELVQPASAMSSFRVKLSDPAVTDTEAPVVEPTITASPAVTDQLWVDPAVAVEV